MDKEVVCTHTHIYMMEYYTQSQKKKNNGICSNVDQLEIVIVSEASQKDRYHKISLKCGT